jgi:hypothetical protein
MIQEVLECRHGILDRDVGTPNHTSGVSGHGVSFRGARVDIRESGIGARHGITATKYRLWADGASEDETRLMGELAERHECIAMCNDMRRLEAEQRVDSLIEERPFP